MLLGMLELYSKPSDLCVGLNRIHFPAGDLSRGGVELGLGLGNAGYSSDSAVLQAIDFFTGESQRRPCALQRDLVWSRINQKKKIAFLHLLVVAHVQLDDVTVDLRSNANEVGAHCSVVRLRPYLPLKERHDHDNCCSADNSDTKHSTNDAAGA